MTVHYGFFNSSNGDRVYDAEDFSRFFDGIIFDGVYSAVGNRFNVEPVTGMYITVDTGRAWFDHTWTFNDQKLTLELQTPDTVYNRIDAVVIEVNKDQRKNFIKTVAGTPAATPAKPTLTKTDTVIQYALAYVTVQANAENISAGDIEYVVDSSETPLCSALNLAGLPSGGTIGQVLAKKSATSGDVGWYDSDKLPFEKWYLAQGITEDDVIGAYKFVSRANENQALACVNEKTSYILTKGGSPSWNSSTGFYIPFNSYLDNATLRAVGAKSIIMRVTSISTDERNQAPGSKPVKKALGLTGNCFLNSNRTIWATVPYTIESFYYVNSNTMGVAGPRGNNSAAINGVKACSNYYTDGVIGFSLDNDTLYRNGQALTMTTAPAWYGHSVTGYIVYESTVKLVGVGGVDTNDTSAWNSQGHVWWGNSFYIQYYAIYNKSLSAAQHSEIYGYINADVSS